MGLEPEAGAEAHHAGEVSVVVPHTIHPVHSQELGKPDEEVGPASSVVVQQIDDIATTLRNVKNAAQDNKQVNLEEHSNFDFNWNNE